MEKLHENDKTIFNYLNPTYNEMISNIKGKDLEEILSYLNKYYLEYRNKLGIGSDITFGLEIEMEHFKGTVNDFWPFEVAINNIVGNNEWTIKNDITLNWGRELATGICTDKEKTWSDIKKVCEFASLYGEIDIKCASHVNIGSQILGDNPLYWYRFLKLWSVYENVIFRFGYGEYLTHFPFVTYSGKPIGKLIIDRLELMKESISHGTFFVLHRLYDSNTSKDFLKKNAVSFLKMYGFSNYNKLQENCVIEIRNCLGTLNPVVWQNYTNFFIKLMLYCKSDKFNEDVLDRRLIEVKGILSNIDEYSNIYLDQAIELSDMIFDNNLDKIYFLRQYLKSFEISNKPMVRSRKFTVTGD